MQIAKCAEYFGTTIGPEGHAHRWTEPRKRFIQRIQKINASTTSLVERFVRHQDLCSFGAWDTLDPTSEPDHATLKAVAHALQCTAAGPYNAIPANLLCVGSCVDLDPTWLGSTLSASRPAIELPHVRTRSSKAFKRFRLLVNMILLQCLLSALIGKEISGAFHGS